MCCSLYVCKLKRNVLPITLSAILGGIYSILSLFIQSSFYILQLMIHIPILLIMCVIATPSKSAKTVFRVFLCFLGLSSLGGGIITSIFSFLGKYFIFGSRIYADITPFELIAVLLITGLFATLFFIKTGNKLSAKTARVTISFHGKNATFEALIDSGNLLTDPISNDGIILIKYSALKDIFTVQQLDAIKKLDVLSESFPTGIRLISSDRGLIPVFRPENAEVKVYGEKGKRQISIISGIDFSSGTFGGTLSLIPQAYVN
jgi:stage II sporulation protein GA (sporulation sigma-E factor processing peptidase)